MRARRLAWARLLRRSREVGCAGITRRLRAKAEAPARRRRQRNWRLAFERELDAAVLASFLRSQDREGRAEPATLDLRRLRSDLEKAPFFFDARKSELRADFRARFPAAVDRMVAEADAVLNGDLSWVVPGGTPDWHRALPGRERWPLLRAPDLGIGAEHPLGDVRLAWEVGRCTHLVRLAQAAWLTGEERYAEAAVEGLRSFAAENPPGFGIAWAHAQEVAIRATSWLWIFHLLGDFRAFGDSVFRLWLGQMVVHGEYIRAYLTVGVETHNHRVTELAALAVLGIALPVLRAAAHWRRFGLRSLEGEILRQIDAEGASAEGSTHYQAFVLDSCLATLLLAERAGLSLRARARDRIARMAEFLAVLLRADGTIPAIGDTDAGRAWRLGLDPLDRRDLLAAASVAFAKADWGAIAGDASGAFWLTGGRKVPGASRELPAGGSWFFRDAGIATARTDYGLEAEIVLFRAGATRFRPDVLTGHSHADALSVGLRLGSDDVLLDPGTYRYSEGEGWRAALRGTSAHCCVLIDGLDQADVRSERFGISGLYRARWLGFQGDDRHLLVEAEHPAGIWPRVRRRMAWLRGGIVVLCDEILGDGDHRGEVWFQLPASRGEPEGSSVKLIDDNGRTVLLQGLAGTAPFQVHRPSSQPGPGWYSPRFGVVRSGTAVSTAADRSELPLRMVTLVQMAEAGARLTPGVAEVGSDGGVSVSGRGFVVSFPSGEGIEWRATG